MTGGNKGMRILALGLLMGVSALPAAAREQADLILHHGKVLTVDPKFSVKSVVVVRGDRIVAVGGEELRKRYAAAKEIDLGGRTLMPGFTDTHLHPQPVAPSDIDSGAARSVGEVQDMLRRKAAELGPGKWITGCCWQESNLAENRNLSRADLDAATPNNPVILIRNGGHSSVSNSMALKIAGLDRNTPDPKSGLIEHDASGELNGIIRERNDLVRKFVPPATFAEMRPAYVVWLKHILSLGITSFFNASGTIDDEPVGKGGIENPPPNLTFKRARELYAEQGANLPRMTMYINHPGAERLGAFGLHTGYGDNRVRLGAIGEMAVDGGFTGPTAWLLADYKGQPGFRGKGRFTDAELQEAVDSAAKLGWQMGLHAIGDAAIAQTITAYANSLASNGLLSKDHRWFTDHFTIMPPEATMATMKQDKIMIAQQPNFLYNLEDRYEQTLDDWRLLHNNPVATPTHKYGLFVAFGSDNLPVNPLVGLYAAVTRKGPSGRTHGLEEEGVSREEAIRMYTANGPYLSFEEKEKGTIEPGKLADMVVLPFDPMTADPEAILKGQVDMTFVGGKLVYKR
ncbi:amidohydrolase [Sphingobium nicotianae]|uniref:Amidohydrolase n=1 Tax=Sphingobium nicotianae TaxID=2782607 RepID=A0A9X1DBE6_9SPHN|nr:amidohydrolase [Sphingobium nicotianae]MBT2186801.1 amidohydrolase [Sphingobium nicotianae]